MSEDAAPLSEQQLHILRAELERMLARLQRSMRISDQAARPVELDQSAVGRLSRIDALQNQGLTQGLQNRERLRLSELAEALDRMEHGRYGVCAACGHPIRFARLELFPETRTCSACAG